MRSERPERIRMIVGDSTQIGCELLRTALNRDRHLEVVALATASDRVIAAATTSNPEIVLLNRSLEDGPEAGLTCLRRLCAAMQSIRVIMLFQDSEQKEVVEAFRAGAKGVFRRSESLHSLIRCIHVVHDGQIWASSTDLNMTLQAFSSGHSLQCVTPNGEKPLTRREQQVVELVAEGLTNREISDQLHLREHTVKNYLFRIYDKLGISTRVELIMYAISHSAAA